MIFACFYFNQPFLKELLLIKKPYTTEENIRLVNRAYAIRDLTKETASVGVFWAGIIPFYSERYAIDFLGRSDPEIANLPPDLSGQVSWSGMNSVPGHNKYDLTASIIEKKPTYIQGAKWGGDDVTAWVNRYYVLVSHGGVTIPLLMDSPDVLWEHLNKFNNESPILQNGSEQ